MPGLAVAHAPATTGYDRYPEAVHRRETEAPVGNDAVDSDDAERQRHRTRDREQHERERD